MVIQLLIQVLSQKINFGRYWGINETKMINRSVDYHTWLKYLQRQINFFLNKVLGKNIIHESNLSNRNMTASTKAATDEFKKYLNYFGKRHLCQDSTT